MAEFDQLDYKRILKYRGLVLSKENIVGVVREMQQQSRKLAEEIEEVNRELGAVEPSIKSSEKVRRLRLQMSMCCAQIATLRWKWAFFASESREEYLKQIEEIYRLFKPATPGIVWFDNRYKLFQDLSIVMSGPDTF